MTWPAPIEATISTFAVLHTPVTLAPNAVASCTANVPTSPAAPLASTRCPGLDLPLVPQRLQRGDPRHRHRRRLLERQVHSRAGQCRRRVRPPPAQPPPARTSGWPALERHRVVADADVLSQGPAALQATEHLTPGPELRHVSPTASTDPAMSAPSLVASARDRDSPAAIRTRYGAPRMKCQSSGLTDAAPTRTSTSSSPTAGISMSASSRTSGG